MFDFIVEVEFGIKSNRIGNVISRVLLVVIIIVNYGRYSYLKYLGNFI